MRFDLEGLEVFFPYEKIYSEQYEYMLGMKRALDAKGHALLEMPTGTGKTVCLVSLVTSYQFQYPATGKLIYCTRTVPEMAKTMEEIRRVIAYRTSEVGEGGGKILALCLSSRKNLCIHHRVEGGEGGDRDSVDSICRSMTASWVRNKAGVTGDGAAAAASAAAVASGGGGGSSGAMEQEGDEEEDDDDPPATLCSFYERYAKDGTSAEIPQGVYSLDDLKDLGKEKGWCPYFLARQLLNRANIVVYNYQYMLDPKVANLVSKELEAESIVVFDEAHNIDNVCIEALSVVLDRRKMDVSMRGIHKLTAKVTERVTKKKEDFQRSYQELVNGMIQEGTLAADQIRGAPILSDDVLQEQVPGCIRKDQHFVSLLKKVVLHLKGLLDGQNVEVQTALSFMNDMHKKTILDRQTLKFTSARLNHLLKSLEITSIEEYGPLLEVANFATLLSTYTDEGFNIVMEPQGTMVRYTHTHTHTYTYLHTHTHTHIHTYTHTHSHTHKYICIVIRLILPILLNLPPEQGSDIL